MNAAPLYVVVWNSVGAHAHTCLYILNIEPFGVHGIGVTIPEIAALSHACHGPVIAASAINCALIVIVAVSEYTVGNAHPFAP